MPTLTENLDAMPVLDDLQRTEASLIGWGRWRASNFANSTGKVTSSGWARTESGWTGVLWRPNWFIPTARVAFTLGTLLSTFDEDELHLGLLVDDDENGVFAVLERYDPAEHEGDEWFCKLYRRIGGERTNLAEGWLPGEIHLEAGDKIALSYDRDESEGWKLLVHHSGEWVTALERAVLSEAEDGELGEQVTIAANGPDTTYRIKDFAAAGIEEEPLASAQYFFNPGFENWPGTLAKRWEKEGEGTLSKETTIVDAGSNALKGAAGSGQGAEAFQVAADIEPDTWLKLSLRQRLAADEQAKKIRVTVRLVGGEKAGYYLNFTTGEFQAEYDDECSIFPLWYDSYREVAYQFKVPVKAGVKVSAGRWNEGESTFYLDEFSLSDQTVPATPAKIDWGLLHNGMPDQETLDGLIAKYGSPNYIGYYRYWGDDLLTAADEGVIGGRTPVVSLEPTDEPADKPTITEILEGKEDAYIDAQAEALAAYGKTVILRPYWEMNIGYNFPEGERPDPNEYVEFWEYLVDRFNAKGATNVKWCWCPNVDTDIFGPNDFFPYFPGDDYVDYVGIDGYANSLWDPEAEALKESTLEQVFFYTYSCLAALSEKPLFLGEFAVDADYGDTAEWIEDGLLKAAPETFPRIEGWTYFDYTGFADAWNLSESEAKEDAFATVTASSLYLNDPTVTTLPATQVTPTSAVLNGTVDPNGLPAVYYFELWPADWETSGWPTRENICKANDGKATTGWVIHPELSVAPVELGTESHPAPSAELEALGITHALYCESSLSNRSMGWLSTLDAYTEGKKVAFRLFAYATQLEAEQVRARFVADDLTTIVASDMTTTGEWVELAAGTTVGAKGIRGLRVAQNGSGATKWYFTAILLEPDTEEAGQFFPRPHELESGQAVKNENGTYTLAVPTYLPASKDGDAGEGDEPVAVSEIATGLENKTTYKFRLVAENEA